MNMVKVAQKFLKWPTQEEPLFIKNEFFNKKKFKMFWELLMVATSKSEKFANQIQITSIGSLKAAFCCKVLLITEENSLILIVLSYS